MSRMRRGFTIDNKKYSYIKASDFDISKLKLSAEKFRFNYLKIGVAFDIETTSYYSPKYDKDLATMYIWQLAIDKDTIIGRTWGEFIRVINTLNDYAAASEGVIMCLVQNLSFEFQFIKSLFDWNKNKEGYPDIFAKDDRTILYAKYKNIEFRDTLALTGMGLARFKKKLTVIGIMGQMQGIHTAANPAKNPINKSHHSDCSAKSSPEPSDRSSSMTGSQRSVSEVKDMTDAESVFAFSALLICPLSSSISFLSSSISFLSAPSFSLFTSLFSLKTGLLPLCFSATSDGGIQLASLQAPYSR